MYRYYLFGLLLWLSLGSMVTTAAPLHLQDEKTEHCFRQTGLCITGRIFEYWQAHGDLLVFGFPTTPQRAMVIDGQTVQVQWFERTRLELHPQNDPPYDVIAGRLGLELLQQQGRNWRDFAPSRPQDDCLFFAETQQNICGVFLDTWRANGLELDGRPGTTTTESLALYGMPLSAQQFEKLSDGSEYLVQWFERARFEWHPQNPPENQVLLGLLGDEIRTTPTSIEATAHVGGAEALSRLQYAADVAVAGSLAYVATGAAGGLVILDVSEADKPRPLGSLELPGNASRIAVADTHAYIAAGNAGLRIVDISDPTNPFEIGLVNTPGEASNVAVSGNFVYITDTTQGNSFHIIDSTNPTKPIILSSYPIPDYAQDLTILGDYAYIAGGAKGHVIVIDVADPTSPRWAVVYDPIRRSSSIAVAGNYAYVVSAAGLSLVNISDPTNLSGISTFAYTNTPGSASSIAVEGNRLSIATSNTEGLTLSMINIADPFHPTQITEYQTTGQVGGLAIANNHAYIAAGDNGLIIVSFV